MSLVTSASFVIPLFTGLRNDAIHSDLLQSMVTDSTTLVGWLFVTMMM